jgi:predicted metalloprotease with PDZ domain
VAASVSTKFTVSYLAFSDYVRRIRQYFGFEFITLKLLVRASLGLAIALTFWLEAHAQPPRISIRVVSKPAPLAIIEGTGSPTTSWSFRDTYAGVIGLGRRIGKFELIDGNGAPVSVRTIAPGQFESAIPAVRFRYEMNLSPPAFASDSARVSWLTSERGLLMLRDLLPLAVEAGRVEKRERAQLRVEVPDGWSVNSNERLSASGEFDLADSDNAVFAVGPHIRLTKRSVAGLNLNFLGDGDWAFTDEEALDLGAKILNAHREVIGGFPTSQATLIVFPFPQAVAGQVWAAEARANTVTVLIGKLPSKVGALAQLSTPLSHELLHLWVPNGLELEGDYDWFYEGFTVYQAAVTAVRLGLLTFPEFLTAISRAYDAYAGAPDRDRRSLVDASRTRWTGGSSAVYSKSMVVALLYDLSLRRQSRGKRSLNNVYRKLFEEYRSNKPDTTRPKPVIDGNDAVGALLGAEGGMQDFVDRYIRNPGSINLQTELEEAGLQVETFALRTRISVNEKLSKPQRDLLRELGYNDAVRSGRSGKVN